jgi:hypothetical protein
MSRLSVAWLTLAAVPCAIALACGSSSNSGNGGGTCSPGQSIACVGVGGCAGGQACNSDGSGYGPCLCGSPGGDASQDGASQEASDAQSESASGDAAGDVAGDTAADADGSAPCMSYVASTVAAMRTGGANGCFELDHVTSIAATGAMAAEIYVQDPGGGNFSGMQIKCGPGWHPCASAYNTIGPGADLTVKGAYLKSSATGLETFAIDSIVTNGVATPPTAATATLADIQRSSTSYKFAFQKVTVALSSGDKLVMYDWTPSEYVAPGPCPYQLGFGMIPMSVGGATPGAACSSGTAQPAGQATPNAGEVLIDRRFPDGFFTAGFTVSSDCRCAKAEQDTEPSAISSLSGTVAGILIFDVPGAANSAFMAIAPTNNADAPITGTVPGQ